MLLNLTNLGRTVTDNINLMMKTINECLTDIKLVIESNSGLNINNNHDHNKQDSLYPRTKLKL